MSLESGTRLGPYEILAPIGAGGMGEVYKAKDTRLDRIVAVKVLPEHLAASPERKQRFEREAKAISQLNHPHICTLYDVGEQDGIDYLVMEYIEGETLAERLKRGPLPFDEALRYGQQLADGLGMAHRQGVVHRDIKPGNVVLTQSGPKLLDFGLAKLRGTGLVSGDADASALPTQDKPLTDAHTVLGTIQYMAPEQLEGKEADARSDIFAFGALLYEMVTGEKAFDGDSQASLIAAILEKEPAPISPLQPLSPPAFDRVLRTCLAKKPDNRWQNVEDVGRQLEWIAEGEQEASAPKEKKMRAPILLAAAAALLATVTTWIVKPAPSPNLSPVRFSLPLSSSAIAVTSGGAFAFSSTLAISPDGSVVIYTADEDSRLQLHQRRLDQFDSQVLPGTENAGAPFFSPDGEWVGFFTTDQLRKVRLDGGEPTTICNCRGLGASWGENGNIIYTTGDRSGLYLVSENGGEPERLTEVNPETEYWHYSPHVLPDQDHVLFSIWNRNNRGALYLLSLETGQVRPLGIELPITVTASYQPTGHILFANMTGLAAVPFDTSRMEVTGVPVTVVEEVLSDAALGFAHYAVSESGTLIYVPGFVDRQLLWVQRGGGETAVTGEQGAYLIPRLSPDGTQVAMVIYDDTVSQRHIWVLDLSRGALARLTFGDGHSTDPVWSPDGERIAFTSSRSGDWRLYWKSADGSGEAVEINPVSSAITPMPASWSPDGQWLLFKQGGAGGDWNIGALRLDGTAETKIFLDTPYEELFPSLSPDGQFLAYTSNETGRREVYVRAFPDLTGKRQISNGGGAEPVWAKDGSELFYRENRKLVQVEIRTSPDFSAGKPKPLFEGMYEVDPFGADTTNYDVTNDGQRFIMIGRATQSQQLNVVLNWSEELKRRVPTGN